MTSSEEKDNIEAAVKNAVEYLYPIKGDCSPELTQIIATLRQLINEEFVGKNKPVSSQFIYDTIYPVLEAEKHKAVIAELNMILDDDTQGTLQAIEQRIAELEANND